MSIEGGGRPPLYKSSSELLRGCLVLLLFLGGRSLAAQQAGEETAPPKPGITLPETMGQPGDTVILPLYYTPGVGVDLRSLRVDLEYVSRSLRFRRAQQGLAAEEAGADVAGRLTELPPDDNGLERSRLRVDVSLVEKDPSRPLPQGLLAYLTFDISLEAKAFAVQLTPVLTSGVRLQSTGETVTDFTSKPGKITIEIPGLPEVGCFIYSH